MEKDLNKAIGLCNEGKYELALPIFDRIIDNGSKNDDVYRMKGQTLMMLGRFSEAIDVVIDALNINPKNVWTLILMGNIFAKQDNIEGAMHYYDEALKYHPNDVIAINNIGAAYMQQGMFEKALETFDKALDIDISYLNTYYGKALSLKYMDRIEEAWDVLLKSKITAVSRRENPGVVEEIGKLKMIIAKQLSEGGNAYRVIGTLIDELQKEGGFEIKLEAVREMSLSAKLEYAKVYDRDYHRIIYNETKPNYEHFILHELIHLCLIIKASKVGKNQIPLTTTDQELAFRQKYAYFFNKIAIKIGKDEANVIETDMRKGIALQLFNCPIDLLVEDYIYRNYPEVRPLQFLSLFAQESENIKSVESANNAKLFPPAIVKANKLMNMVTSMHLDELYGLNFLNYYRPTKNEYNSVEDLYEEYKAYRDDYTAGEEYDLCRYFIESLGFEDLITWKNEDDAVFAYLKPSQEIEEPKEVENNEKEELNKTFFEKHIDGENQTITLMMAMYMVDAMQRFDAMQHSEVRKVAMEIATIGITGIEPSKDTGYKVPSFGNEDFGGYRLLAYYYVSFAREMPELLPKLSLPFSKAYENALILYKKDGK